MSNVLELLAKGGPVIVPLVGLSILSVACGIERTWFWWKTLQGEKVLVRQILDAALQDLMGARSIAEQAKHLPIGRFLLAALKLNQPTPETFRLAMEAAGDREFVQMRKGDKILETVVAIAPLLGLLGTVTGLITTFFNLKIGGGSGNNIDTSKAALGIAEALITTASGMVVAIIALAIYRVCVSLQSAQIDYFADVGTELELIYRQIWYEPRMEQRHQQEIKSNPVNQDIVDQLGELLRRNLNN
jgi:biopolymer transport protein ExbB